MEQTGPHAWTFSFSQIASGSQCTRDRHVGGGAALGAVEVAFIDAARRAVEIVTYPKDGDVWGTPNTATC